MRLALTPLLELLAEARQRGLLGPGPVEPHVHHALAFVGALGEEVENEDGPGLDLGTGGGVPGLVLALSRPERRWTLLDSRDRSVAFVSHAVHELGLDDRVTVLLGRAEEVARDPAHRARYGVVVARGFGPPAMTAECAAPLLEMEGRLIVSEPPGSGGDRWPQAGLDALGLRWRRLLASPAATLAVMEQVRPAPARFPRRTGVPAKRPLF